MAHQHRTTALDGTDIGWSVSGDGPEVVLVHGITESAASWDPIVERLAPHHRTITMDLRGHGESGLADRYDLEAMAGDVIAVAAAAGSSRPHLVGHSLGGAVVSAVGAAIPVASVVNVDQSLQLGGFKEQLMGAEPALRDPNSFPVVVDALFAELRGPLLSDADFARINEGRRPDQAVVLGVWDLILTSPTDEIEAAIESALAGYQGSTTPYLSLFGIDPGPDYETWLARHIAKSEVEVWAEHGHYPHLVDPDRFVARLADFFG